MSMRKPKANSGSPHTLRDVRSTPEPDVTEDEEGPLLCVSPMSSCVERTLSTHTCARGCGLGTLVRYTAHVYLYGMCAWAPGRT